MEIDNTLLVTGGCGFIGSHFINYIFNKYSLIKIINIDAMYYCANELNVNENVRNSNRYTFIKGKVQDKDLINFILNTYNVSYIVHFAAQSHVDTSFTDSLQYTQDNIVGTHTLIECCRIYGKIKKFIHISTDEVYGESICEKKTENSVLIPTNPYASSKASAELIVQSYYHSFKMPIVIVRSNNIFGPNQYPEKLIPKFIKLLKENKKLTIYGDGHHIRGFLHVSDVVRAVELILLKGTISEIYNIGVEKEFEFSVLDVAKILIKLIKNSTDYNDFIEYVDDRPFNDKRYYISNDKVKSLGWKVKTNFMEVLKELINIGIINDSVHS